MPPKKVRLSFCCEKVVKGKRRVSNIILDIDVCKLKVFDSLFCQDWIKCKLGMMNYSDKLCSTVIIKFNNCLLFC
jgi:hypothetical protein